jgi:hypothetical protein
LVACSDVVWDVVLLVAPVALEGAEVFVADADSEVRAGRRGEVGEREDARPFVRRMTRAVPRVACSAEVNVPRDSSTFLGFGAGGELAGVPVTTVSWTVLSTRVVAAR